MEKLERNALIIKMHNSGDSIKIIADTTGMSKGGIHKIITAYLESAAPEKVNDETKPTIKAGKMFSSFVGWIRLSINCWSNKDTGEVVNVKFVPAVDLNKCGHFITV
jgi:hypothetical protein